MKRFCLLMTLAFGLYGNAQKLGNWRIHLPYKNSTTVCEAEDLAYVGTTSGLYSYDMNSGEVQTYTKVQGMSQISISRIAWQPDRKELLIAYDNSDIDLYDGNRFYNIPDILRTSILGTKKVNDIWFNGKYAYLSCSFGIVKIDLDKKESVESYQNLGASGENVDVSGTAISGDSIYASTSQGIISAPINSPNLADFNLWNHFVMNNQCRGLIAYKGKIYAGKDSIVQVYDQQNWQAWGGGVKAGINYITINQNKLVITRTDTVAIGDENGVNGGTSERYIKQAMLSFKGDIFHCSSYLGVVITRKVGGIDFLTPNGPGSASVTDIQVTDKRVWVATGGISQNYIGRYGNDGFFHYNGQSWVNYNLDNTPLKDMRDFWKVAIDPNNDAHVFVASFSSGLVEWENDALKKTFDPTNSTLDSMRSGGFRTFQVGGLVYDNDGNLWVSNPGHSKPISVFTKAQKWYSFSIGSLVTQQDPLLDITIDDYGQKWLLAMRGKGLVVYKDNNTIENPFDDQYKSLNTDVGNGRLPSIDVGCVTKDHDGNLWVGTGKGLTVFYSPGNVFSTQNYDAQQIIIIDEKTKKPQYLFGEAAINCIAVDAGNRKWVGTRSGAYLVSPDGQKILQSFNMDNSPLISNFIQRIAINQKTGKVYFGTDKGIVSYQGDAMLGGETHVEVYCYPNPVRETFSGSVAVRNLVANATVKITDVAGNLVYETKANGGTATWDCKNYKGERVRTGVYLILSTNADGTETNVAKLLVTN
ncbi:MAG: T9SS type A sorting domain-containing protein [Flavobacteriaceae bacterium]|nr:T9SS type A sorting domain-containing protein [Flavobacteriaceae bacterium]